VIKTIAISFELTGLRRFQKNDFEACVYGVEALCLLVEVVLILFERMQPMGMVRVFGFLPVIDEAYQERC